jgi:hypothetical protein
VTANGWHRQRLVLPFRFGELQLLEVAFDAAVMKRHFIDLGPEVGRDFPEAAVSASGSGVAVVHSCPVEGRLPRIRLSRGGIRYVPCHYPRYYTDTTGDFEAYLGSRFTSKSRNTLKRKVKKLGQRTGGAIDLREYRRAEEIDEWHRVARGVSQATYQERLLRRGLPEGERFLASLREMAAGNRFRGYLLFDRERPIAYLSCPIVNGGAMIYDHVGHDPDYDRLSPGTVLLYLVLERAFADPQVRLFDFTEGEGDHKQRFATHEDVCADVYFFAPRPRNLLAIGAHLAVERAAWGTAQLLERFGLKERLRQLARRVRR